jgi:branched-chain amino acid aminotransferase
LAKQEAMNQSYDEAILLNTASNVADGSISNVFMVNDNQVITPPVSDGALPGVVRSILLEEFSQDFTIIERSISPKELMLADEVFLTNALMGIKSINKLGTKHFSLFSVADQISALLCEKKNYF